MKNLLILSAELSRCQPDENRNRTTWLAASLFESGLSYERVLGSYCGTEETSFALARNTRNLRATLLLASLFEQESVLDVTESGLAYLLCPLTGNILRDLGRVVETKNPLRCMSWTLYHGLFYTTN